MIGTSDQAEQDYHQTRYPSDCILLMGSNAKDSSPDKLNNAINW